MAADTPVMAVLTATRNRRRLVTELLEGLREQTLAPQRFEAVVVDDGSSDGTVEALRSHAGSLPYRLRVEGQEHLGKPRAINTAASLTGARYLVVIDDDMRVSPTLLAAHLRAQQQHGGAVGVGPMSLAVPENADGMTRWFAGDWRRRYERLAREPLDYRRAFGGNLSFPKEAFDAVGGWAEGTARGDDVELGFRLAEHGLPVVFVDGGWTAQEFPGGLRHITWNAYRAGLGLVELYERHPEMLATTVGVFHETPTPRSALLRAGFLRLRPPLRAIDAVDPLLRRMPSADVVYAALHSAYLWRGVRDALGGGERWEAIRSGTAIVRFQGPPSATSLRDTLDVLRRRRYRVRALDDHLRDVAEHRLGPPRAIVLGIDAPDERTFDAALDAVSSTGVPVTVYARAARAGTVLAPEVTLGVLDRGDEVATLAAIRERLAAATGTEVRHLASESSFEAPDLARADFATVARASRGRNGPGTPPDRLRAIPVPPNVSARRVAALLRYPTVTS